MAITDGMVVYGGQPLYIEHIQRWDMRPIYDESSAQKHLLHVHIGVQAVWNPQASRSELGKPALESIDALKQQMTTPRQRLTITIGGVVVLQSPLPVDGVAGAFHTQDGRTGPNPIAFNVIEIMGIKTCLAYFEIETWIPNPCPGTLTAVLGHRWKMSHEYDEFMYCTRHIEGRAVFRGDLMAQRGINPDFFRDFLMHPIPPRFKRRVPQVELSEDGLELRYHVIDEQQPINLKSQDPADNGEHDVVKVRGVWKCGFTKAHLIGGIARYISMTAEAWGRSRSGRTAPIRAILKMVAAFGFADLFSAPTYYKMDLTVDLWDKYARIDCGLIIDSAAGNALTDISSFVGLNVGVNIEPFRLGDKFFNGSGVTRFPDEIFGVTTIDDTVANPFLPYSRGSRGRDLEQLVAQVLLTPCVRPPVPATTPKITKEAAG